LDRYVITILPGGRITIPAAIRRSLDLQTGDVLIWYMHNRELHFRKAKPHEADALSAGADDEEPLASDINHQSSEG
jgi:AbrB family looped-hinge helix DNA binding protein